MPEKKSVRLDRYSLGDQIAERILDSLEHSSLKEQYPEAFQLLKEFRVDIGQDAAKCIKSATIKELAHPYEVQRESSR